jgi:exonuclease VII small subunit
MSAELDALIEELEAIAARLRSGQLGPDEAAALVERCAELAARIGSGLDAAGREASHGEGQERLL